MARVLQPKDRDVTAERLLDSSMRNSYDPDVDIDWDAPLVEGKGFMPEERVSLYGTTLWDGLTPEQRIELSKHEIGSITSVGLWTEIVLMQLLARYAADLDPRSPHTHYALTEIGDETRHAIMFGKGIARLGLPAYGPPRVVRAPAKLFGALIGGPAMFASVLVVEETTDRLQRSMLDDERIQPMIRMINRIHVVEEARHVRYAREELVRGMAGLSRAAAGAAPAGDRRRGLRGDEHPGAPRRVRGGRPRPERGAGGGAGEPAPPRVPAVDGREDRGRS